MQQTHAPGEKPMSSSRIRQVQLRDARLLLNLNASLEDIFIRAGKEFLQAKTAAGALAAKKKAKASISNTLGTYRKIYDKKDVSQALKQMRLEDLDAL